MRLFKSQLENADANYHYHGCTLYVKLKSIRLRLYQVVYERKLDIKHFLFPRIISSSQNSTNFYRFNIYSVTNINFHTLLSVQAIAHNFDQCDQG